MLSNLRYMVCDHLPVVCNLFQPHEKEEQTQFKFIQVIKCIYSLALGLYKTLLSSLFRGNCCVYPPGIQNDPLY